MQGTDLLMLCFKANHYFYVTYIYTKFIHNWVLISIQECGRLSTYIYENNEKLHLHMQFGYSLHIFLNESFIDGTSHLVLSSPD